MLRPIRVVCNAVKCLTVPHQSSPVRRYSLEVKHLQQSARFQGSINLCNRPNRSVNYSFAMHNLGYSDKVYERNALTYNGVHNGHVIN